jgi:hypothetical protein
MKIICPHCRREISTTDVNVEKDIALCRNCNETFSFAELLEQTSAPAVDLTRPPKGVWFHRDPQGFDLGVTTRSGLAFFLVPFMCVWSGFSLGGIYGSQIYHGKFNLFMSLFGIPFVLGTLLFGSIAVMSVCGKVLVSIRRDEGRVFTGVGPFGWNRRFKWSGVTGIREDLSRYQRNGRSMPLIEIQGADPLRFASGINDVRRQFMLRALQQLLRERQP